MNLCYAVDMTLSIAGVGARVRQLRESVLMNQSGLATAIAKEVGKDDFTQGSVSAIERGDRLPSVPVLAALAKVLETSTDYLLGLTDDPTSVGDMDEQVVVSVSDPETRQVLQELTSVITSQTAQEQKFVLDVVRRLVTSTRPVRIIGE